MVNCKSFEESYFVLALENWKPFQETLVSWDVMYPAPPLHRWHKITETYLNTQRSGRRFGYYAFECWVPLVDRSDLLWWKCSSSASLFMVTALIEISPWEEKNIIRKFSGFNKSNSCKRFVFTSHFIGFWKKNFSFVECCSGVNPTPQLPFTKLALPPLPTWCSRGSPAGSNEDGSMTQIHLWSSKRGMQGKKRKKLREKSELVPKYPEMPIRNPCQFSVFSAHLALWVQTQAIWFHHNPLQLGIVPWKSVIVKKSFGSELPATGRKKSFVVTSVAAATCPKSANLCLFWSCWCSTL